VILDEIVPQLKKLNIFVIELIDVDLLNCEVVIFLSCIFNLSINL